MKQKGTNCEAFGRSNLPLPGSLQRGRGAKVGGVTGRVAKAFQLRLLQFLCLETV